MKLLENGPSPRSDRPASMLLHDEPNIRIVAFRLQPGQVIPAHQSPSTVTVIVTEGAGTFEGEDGQVELQVGESAIYAPGEMHAILATAEPLRFMALISPRPG